MVCSVTALSFTHGATWKLLRGILYAVRNITESQMITSMSMNTVAKTRKNPEARTVANSLVARAKAARGNVIPHHEREKGIRDIRATSITTKIARNSHTNANPQRKSPVGIENATNASAIIPWECFEKIFGDVSHSPCLTNKFLADEESLSTTKELWPHTPSGRNALNT